MATKSDEIVDIPLNDLCDILQDDFLNIKDECIAWECVVRWIKYDPEERKKYITMLLQTVRLGILQTEVMKLYFAQIILVHRKPISSTSWTMSKNMNM